MAPPPVDRNGGESTAGDSARSVPTPFLTKTYQLVDDPAVDEIISWSEDGSAFVVWNPIEFARDLLPKYFKHNNFSSFVRQLNTYGFRKIVSDRWEFSNECFRRGEKRLLCDIQRRKVCSPGVTTQVPTVAAAAAAVQEQLPSPSDSGEDQVVSSTCSPFSVREWSAGSSGGTAELIGENERLMKENLQLNKELKQMKSLCSNIFNLMSNYANCNASSSGGCSNQSAVNSRSQLPTALELMPTGRSPVETEEATTGSGEDNQMDIEETRAKLFGVAIGMKRARHDGGVPAELFDDLQLQQPGIGVKSEPSDG